MNHDQTLANVLRLNRGLDARGLIETAQPMPGQSSSLFAVEGQSFQTFIIRIYNPAGTLKHCVAADSFALGPAPYANKVIGVDPARATTLVNLATVSSSVEFNGVGGVVSGLPNIYALNTDDQPFGKLFGIAHVEYYSGASLRPRVYLQHALRNVNGRVRRRLEFVFGSDLSSSGFSINTGTIPTNAQILFRFWGFLA